MLQLLDEKDFEQSFQLGETHFEEWAGDADFDYLYGIAARNLGQHQKAIFAFERVIMNRPQDIKARAALAIAYYQLDNYKASQREFERCLALNPDPELADQIQNYIELMEDKALAQGQKWYGGVAASLGYDTNVNSGLGDTQTELPFPGLGLLPVRFAIEEDAQWQVNAQLGYQHPLTKSSTLFTDIAVNNTEYQDFDQYQKTSADLVMGYQYKGDTSQYKLLGYVQPFWLGDEHYQNLAGVMFDMTWFTEDQSAWVWTSSITRTNNQVDDNLSLDAATTELIWRIPHGRSMHSLSLGVSAERVREFNELSQHNERDLVFVGYAWQSRIADWAGFGVSIDYQESDHKHDDLRFLLDEEPFFEPRHDKTLMLGLDFSWYFSSDWSWQTKVRVSQKDSNVVLYDYDKELVTTGFNYRF
nr:tetratricopeptide repeat protein [Marinifaba aquimaris]